MATLGPHQKLPSVIVNVPKLDPDDFACPICRELAYKPVVNACGHVHCFWCVQQAMNPFAESYCPMCRRVFAHFPRICELLHSFYKRAFPQEYRERARDTHEEERERDMFSPSLGDVAGSATTAPVVAPPAGAELAAAPEPSPLNPSGHSGSKSSATWERGGPEPGHSAAPPSSHASAAAGADGSASEPASASCRAQEARVGPNEGTREEDTDGGGDSWRRGGTGEGGGEGAGVSSAEFACGACGDLLERPLVLNCGHAMCSSCVPPMPRLGAPSPSPLPLRCPTCQAPQPATKLEVCVPLHELLDRLFPHLACQRREARRALSGKAPATGSTRQGGSRGGGVWPGKGGPEEGKVQGEGLRVVGFEVTAGTSAEEVDRSGGGGEGERGGGGGGEGGERGWQRLGRGGGQEGEEEAGEPGEGDDVAGRDSRKRDQASLRQGEDERGGQGFRETAGGGAGETASSAAGSRQGDVSGSVREMTSVQRAWLSLVTAQMRVRAAKSPEEERALRARLEEVRRENYVHVGVGCDGCGVYPIVGRRFRCVDCPDAIGFDLCLDCQQQPGVIVGRFNQRHRESHRMVEMPQVETPMSILFQNVPEIPPLQLVRLLEEEDEDEDEDEMGNREEGERAGEEDDVAGREAEDGRQVEEEEGEEERGEGSGEWDVLDDGAVVQAQWSGEEGGEGGSTDSQAGNRSAGGR